MNKVYSGQFLFSVKLKGVVYLENHTCGRPSHGERLAKVISGYSAVAIATKHVIKITGHFRFKFKVDADREEQYFINVL